MLFTVARYPHVAIAVTIALAALLAPDSHAQTARTGGGDASVRLQQMLQQANSDKASLAAENKQLNDKLQAIEKDLAALKKERNGLSGRVTQAESQAQRAENGRQSLNSSLDATQQRLQDVVAKYRELAESARQLEVDKNHASGELATSRHELDSCQAANVDLANIAEEALKRYEDKGVFTALAQKEPFTGIQRTRIANLVDGYRSQVEAKRISPPAK